MTLPGTTSDSQEPESWDDEFELDDPGPSTSRRQHDPDEDDTDFGWGEDDEDKTLTARTRVVRPPSPPPPVPPLPAGIQSPTISVFSSSSSTTQLRPTVSRTSAGKSGSGFSNLPPSPPMHQERRRLKKKSRVPQDGVYEMQEYPMSDEDLPIRPTTPPPATSPILQRIGSVKNRFSGKKKRVSSTPSDVVLNEESTPRPATPPSQSKSWFFRPQDADPNQSPKLNKRKSFGLVRKGDLPSDLEDALNDRYAGLGLGRAGSANHSGTDSTPPSSREGSRSWMGNMRRISLSKQHKRGVSVASGEPPPLLPPIELRPPSPMFDLESVSQHAQDSSDGTISSYESLHSNGATPSAVANALKLIPGTNAASLGRNTTSTIKEPSAVLRRNSLGDLKIPARISQAQVGLRRDLSMVREFAKSVDELKDLQLRYADLQEQVQALISAQPKITPRSVSPSIFRPRSRSNTQTQTRAPTAQAITNNYNTISSRYNIAWECAELLIELGGGTPAPATSASAPAMSSTQSEPPQSSGSRKSRERAITLTGDDRERDSPTPKPPEAAPTPAPMSWRASTGRHDLSSRQLLLLRDMLNQPPTSPTGGLPARSDSRLSTNRDWRWGDAMGSTVTLPSEENPSSVDVNATPSAKKKKRSSKMGMSGIRDMLRSLKGQATAAANANGSSAGVSKPPTYGRRRAKTSSGPEIFDPLSRPTTPYNTNSSLASLGRPSPRRPSLASIFRLGKATSSKTSVAEASQSNLDLGSGSNSSGSSHHDGWDDVDEDLIPHLASLSAGDTIRVRRGLFDDANRLSHVEEEGARQHRNRHMNHEHQTPTSGSTLAMLKSASLRSIPESRLAMTPENIKPLLENAREVKRQLTECLGELRFLLDAYR